MEFLDKKIIFEMKQEIEESVFTDEMGEIIDSMAGLPTDKEIIDEYCPENAENIEIDDLDLLD